jgi:Protein of unknown function (DUF1266)
MCGKIKLYPVYLLLLFLSAYALGKDPNTTTNEPNESRSANTERKIVTGAMAWALGCGGVLNERNHGYHDSLTTVDLTETNIRKTKKMLEEDWGVKSRKDLTKDIAWIINGGHRAEFEYLGTYLKITREVKYNEILEQFKDEPQIKLDTNQIKQRITTTKKYYDKLGKKSLMGWDYCRLIMLCRWGYTAGYISEEEAWGTIMPFAGKLQNVFETWGDLGRNYIIGRQFWSYQFTKENGYLYNEAFVRMLEMRSSPWNKYPWKMNLTEGKNVENQQNN